MLGLVFLFFFVGVSVHSASATFIADFMSEMAREVSETPAAVTIEPLRIAAAESAEKFFRQLGEVSLQERQTVSLRSAEIARVLQDAGARKDSCLLALIKLGVGSVAEIRFMYDCAANAHDCVIDPHAQSWFKVCATVCAKRLGVPRAVHEERLSPMPESWY